MRILFPHSRQKFLDEATVYVCFCAYHFDLRLLFLTFKEGFYFFFENVLRTCIIKKFLLFQEQQMSENKPHMGLLYNWVQVKGFLCFFYLLLT